MRFFRSGKQCIVLLQDKELLEYLHDDRIKIDDVVSAKKYLLMGKKIPALCLDRVDGILEIFLFCQKMHSFEKIIIILRILFKIILIIIKLIYHFFYLILKISFKIHIIMYNIS